MHGVSKAAWKFLQSVRTREVHHSVTSGRLGLPGHRRPTPARSVKCVRLRHMQPLHDPKQTLSRRRVCVVSCGCTCAFVQLHFLFRSRSITCEMTSSSSHDEVGHSGCQKTFLSLLTALHNEMQASIRYSGQSSKKFKFCRVVKQGCVLALHFLMFISLPYWRVRFLSHLVYYYILKVTAIF